MRHTLRPAAMAAALMLATAALAQERQVYAVPAGAHPHDVAPAPNGLVWYTAQNQGALGILDPATGAVRQVPLGQGSRPHGVIQGPDGAAWITDGGLNAIVRFDPVTEAINVWRLPAGSGNANLNTAAFAGDGILWFTGQNGVYGRLDPATGIVTLFQAPQGRGPYGIAATPAGEIYFVSLAGSYLARIDRATGAAMVIEPPTPNRGARRVWSDSQGRALGLGVERRAALGLRPARRQLEELPAAGRQPRDLCGLCRRARHRLGLRLRHQHRLCLRSGDRGVHRLCDDRDRRGGAADPGPARRGLAAGIGDRPPGRDPNPDPLSGGAATAPPHGSPRARSWASTRGRSSGLLTSQNSRPRDSTSTVRTRRPLSRNRSCSSPSMSSSGVGDSAA